MSKRIKRSGSYSEDYGKHTNWVEGDFSRLRHMIDEQHYLVSRVRSG